MFEMPVSVRQDLSTAYYILFIIALDAISELVRLKLHTEIVYVDDLNLAENSEANLQEKFVRCQNDLESN